jgi:hypothetical protein
MAYAAQAGGPEASAGAAGGASGAGGKDQGDVLDAEFEEVKGDDKDRKAS